MDTSMAIVEDLRVAWNSGNVSTIKASDLYRIGVVFQQLSTQQAQELQDDSVTTLQSSYQSVLESLPVSYRRDLFSTLLQGFTQLLQQQQPQQLDHETRIIPSTQALSQLYQSSPLAGASSTSTMDTIRAMCSFHQSTSLLSSSSSSAAAALSESFVTFLILLLRLTTSIRKDTDNLQQEQQQQQQQQRTDQESLWACINILQEEGLWSTVSARLDQENPHWKDNLLQTMDPDQQDYFATMLEADSTTNNQHNPISWSHPESKTSAKSEKTTQSSSSSIHQDPLQPLIDQVAAIIHGLGEGFIETALSLYKGNVEQTVSTLLLLDDPSAQSQLPAQLLITDRSLPRRRKLTAQQMKRDEDEAKQVTKATLQAMEAQQQAEANLLSHALQSSTSANEYDDDYDDQWDDTDGMAAGADSGLYDDYQAVKAYNKVYREMEADQSFWEENRNTNRQQQGGGGVHKQPSKGTNNNTNNGDGKTYRGPDKLRGGRIPQAHGGGRGGGRRGKKNSNNHNNAPNNDAGENTATTNNTESSAAGGGEQQDAKKNNTNNNNNPRRKNKALAKRRDQQKKAMYSRSG